MVFRHEVKRIFKKDENDKKIQTVRGFRARKG